MLKEQPEDIRIYDIECNLLLILSKISSVNWTIYYNKVGTVEIHMAPNDYVVSQLLGYDYLLVVQGERQAVCTSHIIDDDIGIYGRTLNWFFEKRIVLPFQIEELGLERNDAESLVRYLVQQAYMVDRTMTAASGETVVLKKVDNFILAPSTGEAWPEGDYSRETSHKLIDVVIEYLDYIRCGQRLIADTKNKQFVFEIYQGQERQLRISEDNRNASGMKLTVDCLDYCNSGFFEKTQEQAADEEQEGNAQNTQEWFFVDQSDDITPLLRFEGQLSGTTASEAKASLATKKKNKTIDAEVQRLRYGVDYSLGDILSVEFQSGSYRSLQKQRVIGINYYYEIAKGVGIKPILEDVI